jgi:hypothetical protein
VNGHPDGASLLGLVGWRYGRALVEALPAVEQSLGLAPGILLPLAPVARPPLGLLDRRFERLRSIAICPACVAERRPHHLSWRHVFVTACLHHELVLRDTCPRCRTGLSWNVGGYRTCACGYPLSEFDRAPAAAFDVALSALVAGAAHPSRALLPPSLDTGEVEGVGSFLRFLASHEGAPMTGKPGKTALPGSVVEARAFLAPLGAILSGWPAGFDGLVRRRLLEGDRSQQTAAGRLGRWYHGLMHFGGEAYLPFRERLVAVVRETFSDPYLKAPTIGTEGAWLSAAAAARVLGARPDRIVEAVAAGAIEGRVHHSGLGHRHCSLTREAVTAIAAHRARFRDARSIALMLGISKAQLRLLADAGLLPQAPERLALVDGSIDGDAIEQTVATIRAGAMDRLGPTIPFSSIGLRRTTDRGALIEVLRGIFSGSIAPVSAPDGAALGAFEFLSAEIEGAVARLRRGRGWTAQQVAEVAGWKEACVSAWCRQGLIVATPFPRSRGIGYAIEPEALAAFQARYVTVAALARDAGCSPRGMLRRLADAGVATHGAFADGRARRGHVVRIADLVPTVAAAPTPPQTVNHATCSLP